LPLVDKNFHLNPGASLDRVDGSHRAAHRKVDKQGKMEIWRNIVGHGHQSEVSNLGRVRSHYNGAIRRRCKRFRNRTQCATITLCENGIHRKRSVASLVLTAFHGPAPHGHVAHFLDGDRDNCRLANLTWLPRNIAQYRKELPATKLRGVIRRATRFESVVTVGRTNNTIGYYDTEREAAVAYIEAMHTLDAVAANKAQEKLDEYDIRSVVSDIVDIVAGQ
jgi:hypothetical protein